MYANHRRPNSSCPHAAELKQGRACTALRVPEPTLAGIENNDQESSTQLHAIAGALRVCIEWLAPGDGEMVFRADRHDEPEWDNVLANAQQVSLGSAAEADEYAETHKLKFRSDSLFRKGLFASQLKVYYARGDSMWPRIRTGDAILFNESERTPVDGAIFVVQWRDGLFAKRCDIVDDIVLFRSDVPDGGSCLEQAEAAGRASGSDSDPREGAVDC